MRHRSLFLTFLGSLFLLSNLEASGGASAGRYFFDTAIVGDSCFVSGRLDNGIAYFILPDPYFEDEAPIDISLVVASGSQDEGPGQSGYAHLLEHCMFLSDYKLDCILDSVLIQLGHPIGEGYNAGTSYEYTNFDIYDIDINDKDNLSKYFDVLTSIASGINITSAALGHEQKVICNEYDAEDEAFVRDYTSALFFEGSSYHGRTPIGMMDNVRAATVKSLTGYYYEKFLPAEKAVVVIGNVDPSMIIELLKNTIGKAPATKPSAKAMAALDYVEHPPLDVCALKSNLPENQSICIFNVWSRIPPCNRLGAENESNFTKVTLSYFLMVNGIFEEKICRRIPMFLDYNVSLWDTMMFSRAPQMMMTLIKTDEMALSKLTSMMSRWYHSGITDQEYSSVMNMLSQVASTYESDKTKTRQEYMTDFINTLGLSVYWDSDREQIQTFEDLIHIPKDSLNVMIKDIFAPENIFYLVTMGEDKFIDRDKLSSIVRKAWDEPSASEPYIPSPAYEQFESRADSLVGKSYISLGDVNFERNTFGGYVGDPSTRHHALLGYYPCAKDSMGHVPLTRLWIAPDSDEPNMITISAVSEFGVNDIVATLAELHPDADTDQLWNNAYFADMVPDFLFWGKLTDGDYRKILLEHNIEASVVSEFNSSLINISGPRGSLPYMLELLGEIGTIGMSGNPSFKNNLDEFIRIQDEYNKSHTVYLQNSFNDNIFGNNPLLGNASTADLAKADENTVREAARLLFSNPAQFDYIISGDIEPGDSYTAMASNYISRLIAQAPPVGIKCATTLPQYDKRDSDIVLQVNGDAKDESSQTYFVEYRMIENISKTECTDADFEVFMDYAQRKLFDILRKNEDPKVYSLDVSYTFNDAYDLGTYSIICKCSDKNIPYVKEAIEQVFTCNSFDGEEDIEEYIEGEIVSTKYKQYHSTCIAPGAARIDLINYIITGKHDTRLQDLLKYDGRIERLRKIGFLASKGTKKRMIMHVIPGTK